MGHDELGHGVGCPRMIDVRSGQTHPSTDRRIEQRFEFLGKIRTRESAVVEDDRPTDRCEFLGVGPLMVARCPGERNDAAGSPATLNSATVLAPPRVMAMSAASRSVGMSCS